MKDITTPVPAEEMKKIVQKCLEKAALINYTQLTDYAQFEGFICIILFMYQKVYRENMNVFVALILVSVKCSLFLSPADCSQVPPEKRLEDMMRLGELCMEVLQQNDEHHSEVEHAEISQNI